MDPKFVGEQQHCLGSVEQLSYLGPMVPYQMHGDQLPNPGPGHQGPCMRLEEQQSYVVLGEQLPRYHRPNEQISFLGLMFETRQSDFVDEPYLTERSNVTDTPGKPEQMQKGTVCQTQTNHDQGPTIQRDIEEVFPNVVARPLVFLPPNIVPPRTQYLHTSSPLQVPRPRTRVIRRRRLVPPTPYSRKRKATPTNLNASSV